MRLAWLAFGVALTGFAVAPVTGAGAGVAGLTAVALLALLGYRDGTWRALAWALIVPAAALAADVITFTPLTLQPETDATIWSPIALYYLPAWALFVVAGIFTRRRSDRPDPWHGAPSSPS